MNKGYIKGFSKLSKAEKLQAFAACFPNPESVENELKLYWHPLPEIQQLFDEFAENTITNYYLPFGIAPNFLIDDKTYAVPFVIEESSVIAAAGNTARQWYHKGGFHTEIVSTTKIGQVHFLFNGSPDLLNAAMPALKDTLLKRTLPITENMRKRGGGIVDIQLQNMNHTIPNYFQLFASFETKDSMGANFINSCLEEFAAGLREFIAQSQELKAHDCKVIMSILSNYTPDCRVKCWMEAPVESLNDLDIGMSAEEFVTKFETAVRIAQKDIYRATTHNKGIFNGIDAVALATGNDFRAIEACGHTWATRNGSYAGLTDVKITNGMFCYELDIAMAFGTVGGLTQLHPLVKRALELLGNPDAPSLMRIAAAAGLANNFGAVKTLVTKGIQVGHMKMHLLNILNSLNASDAEKELAKTYFKHHKVSYNAVSELLKTYRNT